MFHAMECGVQRPFFNPQSFVRGALDMQRNAPAMHGALFERFQNEQSQTSLEIVVLSSCHDGNSPLDIYRTRMPPFNDRVKLLCELARVSGEAHGLQAAEKLIFEDPGFRNEVGSNACDE
jgi:hypothetical protein